MSQNPQRILLFGASGTIGSATLRELLSRNHEVVCLVRDGSSLPAAEGLDVRRFDAGQLANDALLGQSFDAVISCMTSRTGAPDDAWAIDYQAHINILEAVKAASISKMVLLSAICVQKPRLAFQHAKLAFEKALVESGVNYAIVRPTAFFKSLSGQLDRLRAGKPFLLMGNGRLTACKPISDGDLARYLVDCLDRPDRENRILPIGGPGPAITPQEQAEVLFELLGKRPRFRRVPPALFGGMVAALGLAARTAPRLAEKAELARIGQYYATEPMLLWDEAAGCYDAEATPEFGEEGLFDFYRELIDGERAVDRSGHEVF
ncbi:MAG: NAD(P)H-binding protein [Pseudomonadota bacterium]